MSLQTESNGVSQIGQQLFDAPPREICVDRDVHNPSRRMARIAAIWAGDRGRKHGDLLAMSDPSAQRFGNLDGSLLKLCIRSEFPLLELYGNGFEILTGHAVKNSGDGQHGVCLLL